MADSLKNREGTILLVDDQPDQIKIVKSALDQHFFVKVAIRGEVALQIAAAGGIDLILLDVLMPGMDGYEVCRRLKQHPITCEIPVIFLTCKDTQDDETIGLELGAVDFIRKPSSASVVLVRCRNTVALQRAKEHLLRKNAELQQALKIREDVERMSRHDLKGPLAAILGVPEILVADGNCSERQKNLLQMIEKSGYIMLGMINKSLDLFKMENGTYLLMPEQFDLLEILQHVVGNLSGQFASREIQIVMEKSATLNEQETLGVFGEKMLCYPLFYNLILNAIEASSHQGVVRMELAGDDAFVTVRITNAGEVPQEIRSCFFAKYVTMGKQGGTGLGTYSAWLASKTQGGRIELDTTQSGLTSVMVSLPRSERVSSAMVTSHGRSLRILLAEDVYENQVLFSAYLQATPYQVEMVHDGLEAVTRVKESRFDVVIMDVQMPRMDGYTATRCIRQWEQEVNRSPVPVIAFSGHAMEEEEARCRAAGCDAYLAKPINQKALLDFLQRIANQSSPCSQ